MTTTRPRRTRQQTAVLEALSDRSDFVAAQQLHAAMSQDGQKVALATVYRALQAFDEAGEVDTLLTEAGETLYRACDTELHHHHLVCRECGNTVEIDGPAVEQWSEQIAAEHGFSEVTHIVELYGRCASCA
ncbi:Fur family transcriptional regulator [Kytococcus sp. Marseille-QA3725]